MGQAEDKGWTQHVAHTPLHYRLENQFKQIKNNLSEEIEIFTKEIEDTKKKIGILEPKKKKKSKNTGH